MLNITQVMLEELIKSCNDSYGANAWTLQKQEEGYSIRDKGHENMFGFGSKQYLYLSAQAYIRGYITARDYYEKTFEPTAADLKEHRGY